MAETETATKTSQATARTSRTSRVEEAQEEAACRPGAPSLGQRAEVSNLEIVRHYFDKAADHLRLADDVRRRLLDPYREVTVQVPVKRSDGKIHVFSGYRIQHNGARGPTRAASASTRGRRRRGPRARLADDLEDGRGQHPLRRRQGRRQLRPREARPRRELQKVTRSFMDKIEKVLGPTRDIPAPDVNTNAQTMAWMMDEYGKLHGHTPAICTGKPLALEGSHGREAATGRGCVYMFREAARPRPQPGRHQVRRPGLRQRRLLGRRVIMQQLGSTMIAVSDVHGAIRNDNGIDADALHKYIAPGRERSPTSRSPRRSHPTT